MAITNHNYCKTNCGSTECTATYTVMPRCKHKNGCFISVPFGWFFKRKIFVCYGCGKNFDASEIKNR